MRRSSRAKRPSNKQRPKYFPLKGGLNLVDAPITMPNGMVLAAVNYELLSRDGYRRIDGFERFDGQSSPSESSYWVLNFDSGDITEPVVGAQAIGAASGATGVVLLVVLNSGTWPGGDAVGYFVLFDVDGDFIDDENINFLGADDGYGPGYSNGFG